MSAHVYILVKNDSLSECILSRLPQIPSDMFKSGTTQMLNSNTLLTNIPSKNYFFILSK